MPLSYLIIIFVYSSWIFIFIFLVFYFLVFTEFEMLLDFTESKSRMVAVAPRPAGAIAHSFSHSSTHSWLFHQKAASQEGQIRFSDQTACRCCCETLAGTAFCTDWADFGHRDACAWDHHTDRRGESRCHSHHSDQEKSLPNTSSSCGASQETSGRSDAEPGKDDLHGAQSAGCGLGQSLT